MAQHGGQTEVSEFRSPAAIPAGDFFERTGLNGEDDFSSCVSVDSKLVSCGYGAMI
jgi:hypothetical protein